MKNKNVCNKKKIIKYGVKSKTTAMIIAVLFSQWTWVYTYREDAWKFWVGLVSSLFGWVFLFIPNIVVWIWAMIDVGSKPKEWYDQYND